MLRVNALIYLVTETPQTLKTMIEKTPSMAKERSRDVEPMDWK
jgi:hypothetical protein